MTQHIEPAAWMWTDSTGCVHMAGDRPDIYTAAATVAQLPEPLYDAAALAAAEERGRIEERDVVDKATAWDACSASFQKGRKAGMEEAARIADDMPILRQVTEKHLRGNKPKDVAAAIRAAMEK